MKSIEKTVSMPINQAEAAVRAALAEQGFGVLTEIDVAATIKNKLGIDRSPMKILGACNPSLAHRALEADSSVALLMPCNVVLEEIDGGTHVAAADPFDILQGPACDVVGEEASAKINAAMESLSR